AAGPSVRPPLRGAVRVKSSSSRAPGGTMRSPVGGGSLPASGCAADSELSSTSGNNMTPSDPVETGVCGAAYRRAARFSTRFPFPPPRGGAAAPCHPPPRKKKPPPPPPPPRGAPAVITHRQPALVATHPPRLSYPQGGLPC